MLPPSPDISDPAPIDFVEVTPPPPLSPIIVDGSDSNPSPAHVNEPSPAVQFRPAGANSSNSARSSLSVELVGVKRVREEAGVDNEDVDGKKRRLGEETAEQVDMEEAIDDLDLVGEEAEEGGATEDAARKGGGEMKKVEVQKVEMKEMEMKEVEMKEVEVKKEGIKEAEGKEEGTKEMERKEVVMEEVKMKEAQMKEVGLQEKEMKKLGEKEDGMKEVNSGKQGGKAETGKAETGKAETRKAETGKAEIGKAEQRAGAEGERDLEETKVTPNGKEEAAEGTRRRDGRVDEIVSSRQKEYTKGEGADVKEAKVGPAMREVKNEAAGRKDGDKAVEKGEGKEGGKDADKSGSSAMHAGFDEEPAQFNMAAMSAFEYEQVAKLNPVQLRRYEQFRRSDLKTIKVKKVLVSLNPLLTKATEPYIIAVKGLAKLFVGDVVETAIAVKKQLGETGPLHPKHLREAYRRLRKDGQVPNTQEHSPAL
eukprot:GFKZ01012005.1.p1 GENE.GFKZ01012005.1~~GFKZ01012005.1.p1  ORF type:complete len:480 (+),score=160.34 GFKZ01012005.1:507-1946(+)